VLAWSGCVSYVAANIDTMEVGEGVRVHVTPQKLSELTA